MNYAIIFIPFIVSSLLTYAVVPLVIDIANRFHLVDDPRVRPHPAHTHTGVIPRAGGLALYISIAVSLFVFLPINTLSLLMVAVCGVLTLVGLIDDYRDINPYIRFAINCIVVLVVVAFGISIPYVTNPITGGILHLDLWRIPLSLFHQEYSIMVWSSLVAFLWIMWTMNIVGWSAGVDGQMPGFVAISATVLGILSLRYSIADPSQIPVTILAFIVAGAFVGFIPWNFFPQKIMPGYGGKTIAGLLLAILGILSYGKLGTALLVLGVPTVDALATLIRRISLRKSPVWADRKHLHHMLMASGWGKRRIALFYWGISTILGALALLVNSQQKIFALFLVGVAIGGFIVWVNFFSQFSKPHDQNSG